LFFIIIINLYQRPIFSLVKKEEKKLQNLINKTIEWKRFAVFSSTLGLFVFTVSLVISWSFCDQKEKK